jgi:hypothetical protein
VLEFSVAFRIPILPILALAATSPLAAQFQVLLNPKTDQAFEDYRKGAEPTASVRLQITIETFWTSESPSSAWLKESVSGRTSAKWIFIPL